MDLLIKNAKIIDGTGAPAYEGNVGVNKGKIVLTDLPQDADVVIDAAGKYVTPGFVDSHSHGDAVLGLTFGDLCKINHGVTTQIAAQCGGSMAPVTPENLSGIQGFMNAFRSGFPKEMAEWTTWGKYADYVDTLDKIANVKLYVGFNTVRIAVMGYEDRKPTPEELERMKQMVREAMENGALGMSSGLAYVPATFDDVETIIELAKEIAPYGGVYASHIRNESFDLVRSVEEAIEVGRQANVTVNISHFKAMGRRNWGTPIKAIEVIEKAQAEGIKVYVDQYPYNCSMTHYSPCMPPWYFKDGMDHAVE
ncbi:MAG: amidohydrolase family protein, partial [Lachnospiraceae bacterium]|nr:amidohydrolase family protein [Lachnospiraceae bacterium]